MTLPSAAKRRPTPWHERHQAIESCDNKIILVGGGARSGKSSFALDLAMRLGSRRLFLATAQPFDDEMQQRILQHQQERGPGFETIEEPMAVSDTLRSTGPWDVVLLDCLTLWLSNLLLAGRSESDILQQVAELVEVLGKRARHVVLVTNEVGMGLVPETPLGRVFRDVAGLAHQRLSRCADEVYLAVLGTVLRIKPVCSCGGAHEGRP